MCKFGVLEPAYKTTQEKRPRACSRETVNAAQVQSNMASERAFAQTAEAKPAPNIGPLAKERAQRTMVSMESSHCPNADMEQICI